MFAAPSTNENTKSCLLHNLEMNCHCCHQLIATIDKPDMRSELSNSNTKDAGWTTPVQHIFLLKMPFLIRLVDRQPIVCEHMDVRTELANQLRYERANGSKS